MRHWWVCSNVVAAAAEEKSYGMRVVRGDRH